MSQDKTEAVLNPVMVTVIAHVFLTMQDMGIPAALARKVVSNVCYDVTDTGDDAKSLFEAGRDRGMWLDKGKHDADAAYLTAKGEGSPDFITTSTMTAHVVLGALDAGTPQFLISPLLNKLLDRFAESDAVREKLLISSRDICLELNEKREESSDDNPETVVELEETGS
ncbi:hypothetical protein [Microbulbifer epialgicus]|uniref:Uncharacterized protein n=1 Tax=Microbulbifer epialgicus TaxID=393907 RepID=A0ABV4P1F1_9GAMM